MGNEAGKPLRSQHAKPARLPPHSATLTAMPPQALFIDADDTLWENNLYFEQAIADFLSLLDHTPHPPHVVRERLTAIEVESIREHGYGTRSFAHSLLRCYAELSTRPLTDGDRGRIAQFATAVASSQIKNAWPSCIVSTMSRRMTGWPAFSSAAISA